jgi:25S rRNA (uracil2843-N3)-methyltransferase
MIKTQQLLQQLTDNMTPGSCLLVVDSPGSYSTVSINGAEKKYPMQWLLDYTLLGQSAKTEKDQRLSQWEKLTSEDSQWFRLDESLQYPIDLEDMRYQIHLYRRLDDTSKK